MDGMLSQDEINALLQGMDLSDTADSGASPETPQDSSSAENTDNAYVKDVAPTVGDEEKLTDVEKDAIGEVANISMGSSATTLYSLVNRKVNITTPVVTLATWKTLLDSYEKPCVFIQIKYTKGLDGTNILVLKEHDVKVITDLMMGGDGTNTEGELGEAASECNLRGNESDDGSCSHLTIYAAADGDRHQPAGVFPVRPDRSKRRQRNFSIFGRYFCKDFFSHAD